MSLPFALPLLTAVEVAPCATLNTCRWVLLLRMAFVVALALVSARELTVATVLLLTHLSTDCGHV